MGIAGAGRATFLGRCGMLAAVLAWPAVTTAGADWTLTLEAPSRVDRRSSRDCLGPPAPVGARVTNLGPGALRIDSASVRFSVATSEVAGEYLVERPELPVSLVSGEVRQLDFRIRPWCTARTLVPVLLRVELNGRNLQTGVTESRASTASWIVADGADQVLGQPTVSEVRQLERGLNRPASASTDGQRLVVADLLNHRVLLYSPVPTDTRPRPSVVVGQPELASNLPNVGGIGARTLDTPRAACLSGGRLFVADSHNHRVLIWSSVPSTPFQSASVVLGQPDFFSGSSNAGGLIPSDRSLNTPASVFSDGERLFVADQGNHRVLIWSSIPTESYQPADIVLGQPQFTSDTPNNTLANDGSPDAASMSNPVHVQFDGTRLFVTDQGNHRVLIWSSLPTTSYVPADVVVGQEDFVTGEANGGAGPSAATTTGLSSPYSARSDRIRLLVSDGGNNRVLVWNGIPRTPLTSPSLVLGQTDFVTGAPRQSISSNSLDVPVDAFSDGSRLYVSDLGASRVLVYDSIPRANDTSASFVIGQRNFLSNLTNQAEIDASTFYLPEQVHAAGGAFFVADRQASRVHVYPQVPSSDHAPSSAVLGQPNATSFAPNRGSPSGTVPDADRLSDCYSVHTDGARLFVADSGNNRVLLWNAIPTEFKQAATGVLGQSSFLSAVPSAGTSGMSAPFSVAVTLGRIFVADSGNNRVLVFDSIPELPGAEADLVLGQPDFESAAANAGGIGKGRLGFPSCVATDGRRLFVADTANNRVLIWNELPAESSVDADVVLGQPDGEGAVRNAGGLGPRSLSGPFGVHSDGQRLLVADSGNHRVLVWDSIPTSDFATASHVLGQSDFNAASVNSAGISSFTFFEPHAVFSDGRNLFVSDTGNYRVLRFALEELSDVRVEAGPDRVARLGETVVLEAAAAGPAGGPYEFAWRQDAGPVATGVEQLTGATASFVPTAGGVYAFTVSATDGALVTGAASVHLLVDTSPAAKAGPDREVNGTSSIVLDGRDSFDPDGDDLSFRWQGFGASLALAILDADQPVATFVAEAGSVNDVRLTVDDGRGGVSTDTVRVTAHRNPTAVLSAPSLAAAGQRVIVSGAQSSDPEGLSLRYNWSQIAGPLVTLGPSATSPSVSFTAPAADTAVAFRLLVTNSRGGTSTAETSIAIDGTRPTAALGFTPSSRVDLGESMTINVDFSEPVVSTASEPAIDFERTTGTGTLARAILKRRSNDADSTRFSFTFAATQENRGIYQVLPGATDRAGNRLRDFSGANTIALATTGENLHTPVLDLGAPREVEGTAPVTVLATAGDGDGDPLIFQWSFESVPPGSGVAPGPIPSARSPQITFSPDVFGIFILRLTVDDQRGRTASATVAVIADDHADGDQVPDRDVVGAGPAERAGFLETAGDLDTFRLQAVAGTAYDLELTSLDSAVLELSILEESGATQQRTTATLSTPAHLTFRPSSSQVERLVRVRAPDGTATGRYRLALSLRPEALAQPPPLAIRERTTGELLQSFVSTEGTSLPLFVLQFLIQYDPHALDLAGSLALAAGQGFDTKVSQFRRPFVNVELSSDPRGEARPLAPADILRLDFVSAGRASARVPVSIHSVTALGPATAETLEVFRPLADAGESLTLQARQGPQGRLFPNTEQTGGPLLPHVRLDGRFSRDSGSHPRPLSYFWKVREAPEPVALANAAGATPRFTPARNGRYRFALQVSNGVLTSTTSEVTVDVTGPQHRPFAAIRVSDDGAPLVPADSKLDVAAGSNIVLDATASTDLDAADRDSLQYHWEVKVDPSGRVGLPPGPSVAFTAASPGLYVIELEAVDAGGLRSKRAQARIQAVQPANTPPRLTLSARAPGETGGPFLDLGESPETAKPEPLTVPIESTVSVEAVVQDPDVAADRQRLSFLWNQTDGAATDFTFDSPESSPLRSTLQFRPLTPGIYEFVCVAREQDFRGELEGPQVERAIRVRVTAADGNQADAVSFVRTRGNATGTPKTARPLAALDTASIVVTAGSEVLLDGSVRAAGPAAAGLFLFRWDQVQGPDVTLSDPTSPLTTFVAPAVDDGVEREYAYVLTVTDAATGTIRSLPAPVSVRVVPANAQVISLRLGRGPNLVGIPLQVTDEDGPLTVAGLAAKTGASFVAWVQGVRPGGDLVWSAAVPGASGTSPLVEPTRSYLVSMVTSTTVSFIGAPWPAEMFEHRMRGALDSLAIPAPTSLDLTEADVVAAFQAGYLISTSTGIAGRSRFRVRMGPELEDPLPLDRTKGFLIFTRLRGTRNLGELFR